MKNLKLLLFAFVLALVSCTKDGGESKIDLQESAIPNIKKITSTDQGLNVAALNAGQNINLGLTVGVGFGSVSTMDIIGVYTKGSVKEKAVIKANVSGFPTTVNINQTDLYNAFNILNSASDVGLTDKLEISADLKLNDGSVVKMYNSNGSVNYGSGIANFSGITVLQTYIVSCPLTSASIFNGNYRVTADQWQDYNVGDIVPVVYNASNGTFVFRILNTANAYISNSATSYIICTVNPANNTVVVTSNEQWSYIGWNTVTVTGSGTVGSCTGDINLKLNFSGSSQNQTLNLVKI
jgi:hypothetical protein